MLRRTLFPWKFEETIDEAVRYCRRYGIDEVIWKIDAEEFSHGLPTLERIDQYLPWLNRAREQLSAVNVSMSINPWVTKGMRDAGWDLHGVFPDFEWQTDVHGKQSRAQACMLSPGWRQWLCQAYERYASTGPRVLWIEDDLKVHGRESCFCDRHVREFSALIGKPLTRAGLFAAIMRPGKPSILRGQWLDFLGKSVVEVVRGLAATVYKKYPNVQLGLMCSSPWYHASEWRDWDSLLKIVAGPHRFATIRPCMCNYNEDGPRGLYISRQLVSGTLKCARRSVHACTEVENWPFTRYSKSVQFTRAQILLSAAMRCPSMTLNLYDHMGAPLAAEAEYGVMLKKLRPMADALTEVYTPDGVERGVSILHHEASGKFKRLPEKAGYSDINVGRETWPDILHALGLSITYGIGPVTAFSGPMILAYEKELNKLFRRGVLMDLSAVENVLSMGRKDLLPVELARVWRRPELAVPAEEPLAVEFGAAGGRYMTVDHIGLKARIGEYRLKPGARAVSRLVDPDRREVMPGVVIGENRLGGRVAVYPYDLSPGMQVWFMNWLRQRQLQGLARWLFRGRCPLTVSGGAWPLAIRTDYPKYTLVSLFNLSSDPYKRPAFVLAKDRRFKEAALLSSKGAWRILPSSSVESAGNTVSIAVPRALPTLDMLTVKLNMKN